MVRNACLVQLLAAVVAAACWSAGCTEELQPGNPTPPASATSTQPTGRDGTDYTILLNLFSGPKHVTEAVNFKEETAKFTGWKEVYVINKADSSELLMGRYRTIEEAQRVLKKVKAYRSPVNVQVFARAIVIPLPGTDYGPPELNILNTNGMFTVVVAKFFDEGYVGRKKYAVDYCRELRSKGEQAYYYHGPAVSFVCVGSFPEESYPSIEITDIKKSSRVIVDPRIKRVFDNHPKLAVNGREEVIIINPHTPNEKRESTPCYIMEIPRKEAQENAAFNRTGNQKPRQIP